MYCADMTILAIQQILKKMRHLEPFTKINTFEMLEKKLKNKKSKNHDNLLKKKLFLLKLEEEREINFKSKFGNCVISPYLLNKISKFCENIKIAYYSNKPTYFPYLIILDIIKNINFFNYFNKILFVIILDDIEKNMRKQIKKILFCKKICLITNLDIKLNKIWKLNKKFNIPSWKKQQYVYLYDK